MSLHEPFLSVTYEREVDGIPRLKLEALAGGSEVDVMDLTKGESQEINCANRVITFLNTTKIFRCNTDPECRPFELLVTSNGQELIRQVIHNGEQFTINGIIAHGVG